MIFLCLLIGGEVVSRIITLAIHIMNILQGEFKLGGVGEREREGAEREHRGHQCTINIQFNKELRLQERIKNIQRHAWRNGAEAYPTDMHTHVIADVHVHLPWQSCCWRLSNKAAIVWQAVTMQTLRRRCVRRTCSISRRNGGFPF